MWKIIVAVVIALAGMFYLMSKSGNVDLGNSEHAMTESHKAEPAKEAVPATPAAPAAAPTAAPASK